MPPDLTPLDYLIQGLEQALVATEPSVIVERLERQKDNGSGPIDGIDVFEPGGENEPDIDVSILRCVHQSRARRHYVVAPISTTTLSDGDFVSVMKRVVRLRMELSEAEQLEVWVVLVAPEGANENLDWRYAERQFEANQAFARVVVWLPSAERATWKEETEEVLRKLFLRGLRGLPESAQGETTDLSPIDAVLGAALGSTALRAEWRGILLDPDQAVTPSSRAERLIETFERSPEGDKTHE